MSFLYSIYDLKAETYLPVMEGKNDEHAKRTVALAIQQGIPVAQHPEDYELFRLCTYDNQTGYITQDTRPERVASILVIMTQYGLAPASAGHSPHPLSGPNGSAPTDFDLGIEEPAEESPGDAADKANG